MAGSLFVDAPLEPGEQLRFRRVCNQRRGRRTVGGEVSLTDRRLIFTPNRLEQLVRAKPVIIELDSIDHVVTPPVPPAAQRLRFLPGVAKPTIQITSGDSILILQINDAAPLEQLLSSPR